MGQKVNPHGLRVGVIKDWSSRWYSKDETFGDTIVSDYNLRKYLKKRLMQAGVPVIEIERDSSRVRVIVHCAKPGIVIGKGGSEIEKLLKSAVANADHNFGMDVEKLYVAECFVTPGILKNMKRVRPRAQGRAFRVLKRTSHVTIVLKEKEA